MQSGIKIEINMFGVLSSFSAGKPVILEMPSGSNVKSVIDMLKQKTSDTSYHKIIDASALADENNLLKLDYVFTTDSSLAILPPVAGG